MDNTEMMVAEHFKYLRERIRNGYGGEAETENKAPNILKLKFELVTDLDRPMKFNETAKELLKQRAACENGFTREVLVPAHYDLSTLHSMIQELFGWSDNHLHMFRLPKNIIKAFEKVENGCTYSELCGVLFVGPLSEGGYKPTFMAADSKTGIVDPFIADDTYIECMSSLAVEEFVNADDEFEMRDRYPLKKSLVERLTLGELLCVKKDMPEPSDWMNTIREEIAYKCRLLSRMDELGLIEEMLALHNNYNEDEELDPTAKSLIKAIDRIVDPKVTPFTDQLGYVYDFGDDWSVKIICKGAYHFDINSKKNDAASVLMRRVLTEDRPVCTEADGAMMADDLGGLGSFAEKLWHAYLSTEDPEYSKELRDWLKMMDYTGKPVDPASIFAVKKSAQKK